MFTFVNASVGWMPDVVGTGAAVLPIDLACTRRIAWLAGADATYVAAAARLDAPLITWDRNQLERGGQRVTAHRPDAQGDEAI